MADIRLLFANPPKKVKLDVEAEQCTAVNQPVETPTVEALQRPETDENDDDLPDDVIVNTIEDSEIVVRCTD